MRSSLSVAMDDSKHPVTMSWVGSAGTHDGIALTKETVACVAVVAAGPFPVCPRQPASSVTSTTVVARQPPMLTDPPLPRIRIAYQLLEKRFKPTQTPRLPARYSSVNA